MTRHISATDTVTSTRVGRARGEVSTKRKRVPSATRAGTARCTWCGVVGLARAAAAVGTDRTTTRRGRRSVRTDAGQRHFERDDRAVERLARRQRHRRADAAARCSSWLANVSRTRSMASAERRKVDGDLVGKARPRHRAQLQRVGGANDSSRSGFGKSLISGAIGSSITLQSAVVNLQFRNPPCQGWNDGSTIRREAAGMTKSTSLTRRDLSGLRWDSAARGPRAAHQLRSRPGRCGAARTLHLQCLLCGYEEDRQPTMRRCCPA